MAGTGAQLLGLAFALLAAAAANADWQPARPLRIVVPFAPGGQPDIVARTLAEPLGKALGQPVIVENRPGAGGNIAAEAVAKSAPDGLTLLIGTNGPLAVSPALDAHLAFDPFRDLEPVTLVGTSPNLIAVHPSAGVASLQELVAKAKSQPGGLNFASVGKGSVSQLSIELLNSVAGIETVHVPYNGGAAAVMALIAGDVQLLSLNPTALLPQVSAGKVKVVAQTSAKRSALIDDIPTVAQSGYPGFEAGVWMAIMAPAKTPEGVVQRLNAELVRIIRDPVMKAALWDKQWIEPVGSTPREVTRIMREESARWSALAKARGLGLE